MTGKLTLKKGILVRSSERIKMKTTFSKFTNDQNDPLIISDGVETPKTVKDGQQSKMSTNETSIQHTKKRTRAEIETNKRVDLDRNKGKKSVKPSTVKEGMLKKEVNEVDDFVQPPHDEHKKERPVKKNKLDKVERKEFPSLRTRSSPHSLWIGLKNLNKKQRETVAEWGFEKMLRLKINGIPGNLAYYLVDQFDSDQMSIKVANGNIKITKKDIHRLTGLPMGGVKIVKNEDKKVGKKIRKKWKAHHNNVKEVSAAIIAGRLEKYGAVDKMFMLDFVMMFVTSMIESQRNGKCIMAYLPFFVEDVELSRLDWCELIYRTLKECKEKWNREDPNDYFLGPLTVLTLFYLDAKKVGGCSSVGSNLALEDWNFEKLRELERAEINLGGFGKVMVLKGEKDGTGECSRRRMGHGSDDINDVEHDGVPGNNEKDVQTDGLLKDGADVAETEITQNVAMDDVVKDIADDDETDVLKVKVARMGELLSIISNAKAEFEVLLGDVKSTDPDNIELKNVVSRYEKEVSKKGTNVYKEDVIPVVTEPQVEVEGIAPDQVRMDMEKVLEVCQNELTTESTPKLNKDVLTVVSVSQCEDLSQIWKDRDFLDDVIRSCDRHEFKAYNTVVDYPQQTVVGPSFSLGLTQEFGCSSSREVAIVGDEGVAGSVICQTPTLVGVGVRYDSQDDDKPISELAIKSKGKEKEVEKPKRIVKPSYACRSPYMNRPVDVRKKEEKSEKEVWRYLWMFHGPMNEQIFYTKEGRAGVRVWFESMQPNMNIVSNIVECWSLVLNEAEQRRAGSSPHRLFCGCIILNDGYKTFSRVSKKGVDKIIRSNIECVMTDDMRSGGLKQYEMFFFPVRVVDHYFLLCFDLKNMSVDIIDSVEPETKKRRSKKEHVQDAEYLNETIKAVYAMKRAFIECMELSGHPRGASIFHIQPSRLRLKWQTAKSYEDAGIALMRHMETYMGVKDWDCGLSDNVKTLKKQMESLRIKYAAKILLSDVNLMREKMLEALTKE